MFYIIARAILYILCKLLFGHKAYGRGNVPKKGGIIIAPNHASYLDPIFVGVGAHRCLHFIARESLFRNFFFAAILSNVRAFPIKRNFQDVGAMREAISLLKRGRAVLVFPESTRTSSGNLQPAKAGISLLAHLGFAPVVPVYIKGNYAIWPKNRKSIKLMPVSVYFGRPLDFQEFVKVNKYAKISDAYQPFADYIMERIAELGNRAFIR